MIAQIILWLFPMLAAVPLIGSTMVRPPAGIHRPKIYRILPINAALFFLWQWFMSAYGYSSENWQLLFRLVDPYLMVSFAVMGLGMETFDTQSDPQDNIKRLVRSMLPVLLLNTGVQIYGFFNPLAKGFPSALLAVSMALQLDRSYCQFSHQPKVHLRILQLVWLVGVLIPLPVARLFFLCQMAYVMATRQREMAGRFFNMLKTYERERHVIQQIIGEITGSIQDFANLKESLGHFLASLCNSLEAKAGAVYVWDEKAGSFYCTEVHGYFFPLVRGSENVFTRQEVLRDIALQQVVTDTESLIWECGHGRKGLHLRYASMDPRVAGLGSRASNIQTLILEPLVLDKQLLGVLVVENKLYERYFTASDAFLVRNFSHHATMILNTSRLSVERSEKDRLQMELTLGTRIQSDLLPDTIPQVEGISLAGSMLPAKEIGGDYYDFIPGPDGRLGVVIGDVSGKGVPAGMIMTILQTLLHAQYRFATDTKELLVAVNERLSAKIKSHMFVTLLFFEWNPATRVLRYTSCGHEHILHYRHATATLDCLKSGGLALGMVEDNSNYIRERLLPVEAGDTVLLYTDGIIEARNPEDQMYGLERLRRFVESYQGMPVETIHRALQETMLAWRRDREQIDDITCIIMRF